MTAPNETTLTREEVQAHIGHAELAQDALALLADRDELRRELEVCATEAKALGEQVQRLERERDALSAALDERNAFTAKRVIGELEKFGLVKGDQFDTERARAEKAEAALSRAREEAIVEWTGGLTREEWVDVCRAGGVRALVEHDELVIAEARRHWAPPETVQASVEALAEAAAGPLDHDDLQTFNERIKAACSEPLAALKGVLR